MKKILIFLVCSLLLLTACSPSQPTSITVMAAASLTESFTRLGEVYQEAHPGTEVVFNFAGSQALANQISQGAPADVFASANLKYMTQMEEEGFVTPGVSSLFAKNALVVIVPKDNPAGIHELSDLTQTGLKIVFAAEEVPAGNYTRQFLTLADAAYGNGYQDQVLQNVVSNEDNVKAVLTKVSLGEADAGIVYGTDAASANGEVLVIEIPQEINVIAEYPLAVLNESGNSKAAQGFVDFVLSTEGQEILTAFGFRSGTSQ